MPRTSRHDGDRLAIRRQHPPRRRRLRVETLEARHLLAAGPVVINEFLASNERGLRDEDGVASDWIELLNISSQPVNLNGWHLTDNEADLQKWTLPDITLAPGEFLVVFASDQDRRDPAGELHTNFRLSAGGEYLGLIEPDGVTVAHAFAPTFPPQYEDISYGLVQDTTPLVRAGDAASYLAPTAAQAGLAATWMQPSFDAAAWSVGPTGLGYNQGREKFEVKYIKANTAVSNLGVAENVIATPSLQSFSVVAEYDVINFLNTGGNGRYGNDVPFPTQTIGIDVDDFVIEVRATVLIPHAGEFTFGVNSDDGFGLALTNGVDTFTSSHPNPRGASDTLAVFNFTTPGPYDLRLVVYERGGGSSAELFAAPGAYGGFVGNAFRLVGDVDNGGLAVAGLGGAVQTNVGGDMYGLTSSLWVRQEFTLDDEPDFDLLNLRVQYNDGFVAYLNGAEVARRNAPAALGWNANATATRSAEESIVFEEVNLTPFLHLLTQGENVLAIHALNDAAASDIFLVTPELSGARNQLVERYFAAPTPGGPNQAAFISFVADTKFNYKRGFYEAPIDVAVTTATVGAHIRYTLNGTEPTETNGFDYTGPIHIDSTTTLRARAYLDGFQPTNVDTQTYIFLDDVLLQSPDGSPPTPDWPVGPINGQIFDYGMDPDIVNHPVWGPQLKDALLSISTLSIVMDLDDLVSPATGIYTNAMQRGRDWERPISLELIHPDGEPGFQIDAGLRIRGGFSRSGANPKHSFRFFFRNEYDGALEYAWFGDEGVDLFRNMDLRTSQNYSWAFQGSALNTITRDVYSRDVSRDMQQPYTRSRYYHLYINGQYFGLFQTEERPEASFGASYFGGSASDYDVVKSAGSPAGYTIEATDGDLVAWTELYMTARDAYVAAQSSGSYDESIYYRLQGLNPDGTRNPAYPVLLDADNLIDYMLTIMYGGNLDAPLSAFLSNNRPNNWFSIYNRNGESGFQFFVHDAEHTLLNVNENRVGPYFHGNQNNINYSNPQWLHQDLTASAEYRQRFFDRVYRHLFNGGALTVEQNQARFLERANEIALAIIAESARWGDAKVANPFTKDHWQAAINNIYNNYLPQRTNIFLNQLLAGGLYTTFAAPELRVNGQLQHGGPVDPGDQLSLITAGMTEESTLVAAGSVWRYLDNGSNQGTAWRQPGFNDSSWASGPAQLGYGDGDEATVVSFGPNANNKYITTYFRHQFAVLDPGQFNSLTVRLLRDDGAVVYLNGQEVVRSNLPAGTIGHTTLASSAVGGADESTFFNFTIDAGLLVAGVNTLAVEVHQANATSSDLSFDLALVGVRHVANSFPVYYTFNGVDPRLPGGGVNPAALAYNDQPLALPHSVNVAARAYDPATQQWSPLAEAAFQMFEPATAANVVVTEVHYHPHDPTAAELAVNPNFDKNDFEFLELLNIGPDPVDLGGATFVRGITFTFPPGANSVLAAGARLVVVKHLDAFETRYGEHVQVAGVYTGSLDNSGERVQLNDRFGETIFDFTYSDRGAWPTRPDGDGSSLEVIDVLGDLNDPNNWRASSEFGGSPGWAGLGFEGDVVINELLAHTDLPLTDAIELYNRTAAPIDLSFWLLSDSTSNYRKFVIPPGTILPPGGYLAFFESDFNPGGGALPGDFALNSSVGETLTLLEARPDGSLVRFVDVVSFGPTANGESLGRWPNGAGELYPMISRTFGAANSGPRVGPVVISELMYHPPARPVGGDHHLEYLELHNTSGAPVDLSNWSISGIGEFAFPLGLTMPPGGVLLVVPFSPTAPGDAALLADFRQHYGIDASVPLVGPYSGRLDNAGERIQLFRADGLQDGNPPFYPQILEDQVTYDDVAPWPTSPDGHGDTLARLDCGAWGDDPASWTAAAPTPGVAACRPPSQVVDRAVFYNRSSFDGNQAGPGAADDAARATDKTALFPGQQASFANYTSFSGGLNGVMIDIVGLWEPEAISAADFVLRVGNNDTPANWVNAPAPASITVREGAGVGGSDRVTLIWPNGAIVNRWLQVTVQATVRTGLPAVDVFYFGHQLGETGDRPGDAFVDVIDFVRVRDNPTGFFQPAAIDNRFDINRDGQVNAIDLLLVRDHPAGAGASLLLFAPPSGAGGFAPDGFGEGAAEGEADRWMPALGGDFWLGLTLDYDALARTRDRAADDDPLGELYAELAKISL